MCTLYHCSHCYDQMTNSTTNICATSPSKRVKKSGGLTGIVSAYRKPTPKLHQRIGSGESSNSILSISSTDSFPPTARGNGILRPLQRDEGTVTHIDSINYGGYGSDNENEVTVERGPQAEFTVKTEGKKKVNIYLSTHTN